MTVLELAQNRIVGLKKKTAKEWAGPCPACGGTDRFLVWTHRDAWHCRGCDKSGDAVAFLREFDGLSCPEAHGALGKACDSGTCQVADRCRKGAAYGARPARVTRPLRVPAPAAEPEFVPAAASTPEEKWRGQAGPLMEKAHALLLESPDRLAYLAGRGLDRAAVERFRLGLIPDEPKRNYAVRAAWGLPERFREDGKKKKLFIPPGILIPYFDAAGVHRIRIRRWEGEPRYYWLEGSGDDVVVLNPAARAFVVVESDLDGLLVAHQAGDLVGAIPLGSCSPNPKETAHQALSQALSILISLDFEPEWDEEKQLWKNPGGEHARKWLSRYPRARRWPVPAGKDPGDYVKDHGGDIRAWVLSGLPPVFHVAAATPTPATAGAQPAAPADQSHKSQEPGPPDHGIRGYLRGVSGSGAPYIVAETADILARARELFPGEAPFLREELQHLKGMEQEQIDAVLADRAKFCSVFSEGRILGCRPIVGDGRQPNIIKFDPSRRRRAGR